MSHPYRTVHTERPLTPAGHLTLRLIGLGAIALAVAIAGVFIEPLAGVVLAVVAAVAIVSGWVAP